MSIPIEKLSKALVDSAYKKQFNTEEKHNKWAGRLSYPFSVTTATGLAIIGAIGTGIVFPGLPVWLLGIIGGLGFLVDLMVYRKSVKKSFQLFRRFPFSIFEDLRRDIEITNMMENDKLVQILEEKYRTELDAEYASIRDKYTAAKPTGDDQNEYEQQTKANDHKDKINILTSEEAKELANFENTPKLRKILDAKNRYQELRRLKANKHEDNTTIFTYEEAKELENFQNTPKLRKILDAEARYQELKKRKANKRKANKRNDKITILTYEEAKELENFEKTPKLREILDAEARYQELKKLNELKELRIKRECEQAKQDMLSGSCKMLMAKWNVTRKLLLDTMIAEALLNINKTRAMLYSYYSEQLRMLASEDKKQQFLKTKAIELINRRFIPFTLWWKGWRKTQNICTEMANKTWLDTVHHDQKTIEHLLLKNTELADEIPPAFAQHYELEKIHSDEEFNFKAGLIGLFSPGPMAIGIAFGCMCAVHTVELFSYFGLAASSAWVFGPAIGAGALFGIVYSMFMFKHLYGAVQKNIFKELKKKLSFHDPLYSQLDTKGKVIHWVGCGLKSLCGVLMLSMGTVAIILSAGALVDATIICTNAVLSFAQSTLATKTVNLVMNIAVTALVLPIRLCFGWEHTIGATNEIVTGIKECAVRFREKRYRNIWESIKEEPMKLPLYAIGFLVATLGLAAHVVPEAIAMAGEGAVAEYGWTGDTFQTVIEKIDDVIPINLDPAITASAISSFEEGIEHGDFVIEDALADDDEFSVTQLPYKGYKWVKQGFFNSFPELANRYQALATNDSRSVAAPSA